MRFILILIAYLVIWHEGKCIWKRIAFSNGNLCLPWGKYKKGAEGKEKFTFRQWHTVYEISHLVPWQVAIWAFISRWITFLGQLQEAALLHASNQNWESCLEVLHLGQYRGLAVRLLHYLDYKGAFKIDFSNHNFKEIKDFF